MVFVAGSSGAYTATASALVQNFAEAGVRQTACYKVVAAVFER